MTGYNMKILMMVLMVMVSGCELDGKVVEVVEDVEVVETVEVVEEKRVYIVAGQSNAGRCDWSYFEYLTDSTVVDIHIPGAGIDRLIADTDYSKIENVTATAILFVHGETDSYNSMQGGIYVEKVNQYKALIGGSDLYISAVGLHAGARYEESFNHLRSSTIVEAKNNDSWFISFEDAKYFRNWGMLVDDLHFSNNGCMMMMDAFAEQTYNQ